MLTVTLSLLFNKFAGVAIKDSIRLTLPLQHQPPRPLFRVDPDRVRAVLFAALEEIPPPALKEVSERIGYKNTDSYNVGDVFLLIGLLGAERKYNGCWAIAISVNDFTLKVEVHDAVLLVQPDNLNPIDSPAPRRQLPSILLRIKRLRQSGLLDQGAYYVLEGIGRQTSLTEVEELLNWLENHYSCLSK